MALKPLREDKELSAIPVDEPVLVELDPPATGEVAEPAPKPQRAEKPLKVQDEGDDDPVKVLQKQMQDQRTASQAELSKLARERDEALRDAHTARNAAAETEADLIQTGLKAAQDDAKAARAALKAAIDAGDVEAQADAQERIGRNAADIREFERAAATQASEAERRKSEPERQPQNQPSDVNAIIDGMQVMPAEKAWLKEHTDALTDPARKAELDGAYFKAVRKGIVRGTPAYFKFIEAEMGYADEAAGEDDDNQQEERTVMPAAPVSRESRSVATGRQALKPGQVYLSPEQRQIARDIGVSDTAYARGVTKMNEEKQRDPERFAGRG